MRELISKKTRLELGEYLSGFVLREIDQECEAVDMVPDREQPDEGSGEEQREKAHHLGANDATATEGMTNVADTADSRADCPWLHDV